jgi:hypothetical protein
MTPAVLLAATVALTPAAPATSAAEASSSTIKGADPALLQSVRAVADRVAGIVRAPAPRTLIAVRADEATRSAEARVRAARLLPAEIAAARGRAWADIGLGMESGPSELVGSLAADLDGIAFDADSRRLLVDPGRLRDDDTKSDPDADAAASLVLTTGVAPDEPVVGHYVAHLILDGTPQGAPVTTDALLARSALSEGAANVAALLVLFGGAGLGQEVFSGAVRPDDVLDGRLVPGRLRTASPVVASFLEFVYLDGFAQAGALVRAGDFPRLAAERKTRTTTRDVLHLDRPPAAVAAIPVPDLPGGSGLELVDTDVLGEQGIVTLVSLTTGKDNLGLIAGDGWNGDALFRFEPSGAGGTGVTVWVGRFVSDEDAKDMAYALHRCLEARFTGETIEIGADGRSTLARADRVYRIEKRGVEVWLRVASPFWDAKFEGRPPQKGSQPRSHKR